MYHLTFLFILSSVYTKFFLVFHHSVIRCSILGSFWTHAGCPLCNSDLLDEPLPHVPLDSGSQTAYVPLKLLWVNTLHQCLYLFIFPYFVQWQTRCATHWLLFMLASHPFNETIFSNLSQMEDELQTILSLLDFIFCPGWLRNNESYSHLLLHIEHWWCISDDVSCLLLETMGTDYRWVMHLYPARSPVDKK
jgi:hypothetical protein